MSLRLAELAPQGRQLVARRRRRAGATVTQDVDDRRDQSRDGHRGGQGQVDGLGAGMYGDPAQSRIRRRHSPPLFSDHRNGSRFSIARYSVVHKRLAADSRAAYRRPA